MSKQNDGGPAFPLQSIGPDFAPGYAGMSLRDYFAAKALQGMLADTNVQASTKQFAVRAYEIADAMLEVRRGAA
jgi:hypothetical protein